MRWAMMAALGALLLAGCSSPFNPYPTLDLAEVKAAFRIEAYDSDANNSTDGIALTLLSTQPNPPLIGSDAAFERNGDSNVTVWRCPQRQAELCASNRGILSWDQTETVYIRGLPGPNRLQITIKERFTYNTTIRVDETRDTEVWAVLTVRTYDSDGNRTHDGLEINLVDSDKAPFGAGEVRVFINKIQQTLFSDARRTRETTGGLIEGGKLFVDGFLGENRVEVYLRATRYETGVYPLSE